MTTGKIENIYKDSAAEKQQHYNEYITLAELLLLFNGNKKSIFAITSIFFILSLAISVATKNSYKADTVLITNASENSPGLSSITSQLGGIANLVGLNLGGSHSIKDEALAVLYSKEFISEFIQSQGARKLMFPERWDDGQQTWKKPSFYSAPLDWITLSLYEALTTNEDPVNFEPSKLETHRSFIENNLTFSEDENTGVITLSITSYSPATSAIWANEIVKALNYHFRNNNKLEAQKSIKYLNTELERTETIEMRRSIFEMIENQKKIVMLATVREDFVFKVLDRAIEPERKYRPKRLFNVILGTSFGLIISTVYIILLSFRENTVGSPHPHKAHKK